MWDTGDLVSKKEGEKAGLNVVLKTELGSEREKREEYCFFLILHLVESTKGQPGTQLDEAGGASRRYSHHRPPFT